MILDAFSPPPSGSYASLLHILKVPDLPEMPVHVEQWDVDGEPCIILIRALSFGERRIVVQQAKDDPWQEKLLICRYGIKEPKIEDNDLVELEKKNPGAIDALAETINDLGKYDAEFVRSVVKSLAERTASGKESA